METLPQGPLVQIPDSPPNSEDGGEHEGAYHTIDLQLTSTVHQCSEIGNLAWPFSSPVFKFAVFKRASE